MKGRLAKAWIEFKVPCARIFFFQQSNSAIPVRPKYSIIRRADSATVAETILLKNDNRAMLPNEDLRKKKSFRARGFCFALKIKKCFSILICNFPY